MCSFSLEKSSLLLDEVVGHNRFFDLALIRILGSRIER